MSKKQIFKLNTNSKGDEQSHEIFYYSILLSSIWYQQFSDLKYPKSYF